MSRGTQRSLLGLVVSRLLAHAVVFDALLPRRHRLAQNTESGRVDLGGRPGDDGVYKSVMARDDAEDEGQDFMQALIEQFTCAVAGRADLVEKIYAFCRSTGPALSPFNAWVLSKSLETLALRMERHSSNALALAEALQGVSGIRDVRYPFLASHPQVEIARRQMSGGGGIVTFVADGGLEQGRRLLDALRMCSRTANLGDTRTIVTHPASTTHAKLSGEERQAVGITPGLLRVSVGLEDVSDIVEDVVRAIEASVSGAGRGEG